MLNTKPLRDNIDHPRKKWKGCIYHIEYARNLEHLNALIAEITEQTGKMLLDACFYDREEGLIWLPTELRNLVLSDNSLRDRLFAIYPLPGKEAMAEFDFKTIGVILAFL